MRLRPLVFVPLALAVLRGQEPLNRPVALLAPVAGPSAGQNALSLEAAQRAQELGFPALAAQFYRELLATSGGDRPRLTLALATALLDGDHPDQADQVLRSWNGPRGAAWHLRAGLAAAAQRKFDGARAELALVRAEELTAADRPWLSFLQGLVTGAAGDSLGADADFLRAEQQAVTAVDRVHFSLKHEEERIRRGAVNEQDADEIRRNAERFRGQPFGYESARAYAVALAGLGRRTEAVAELRRQLLTLPASERARADDLRLLMGMIAGAGEGEGRLMLLQLLETGNDPPRQRMALQLLAQASTADPERSSFRAALDQLLAAERPHPIREDLLFFRAAWALGNQPPEYPRAESDANELIQRYPGSSLKPYALGILTASAWAQHRYRLAADDAASEQAATPPGEARAELGVLRAEAAFRAGMLAGDASDFRNAADGYAAALRDRPANVSPGELMFQQVEADIESGSLDAAQRALDALASDPAFGTEERWQAEANLARMLKIQGRTAAAYQRVNRLLQGAGRTPALPMGLRARMAWLQAELSYDVQEYARTLELVGALRSGWPGLAPDLRQSIASSSALWEAQADFALGREPAGLAVLARLRSEFPDSDAAVESYMIAADHYAQQDQVSVAQGLYIQLAEKFPSSPYAPRAYFQAAVLAEKLGQTNDLTQATQLIERLVALEEKYPPAHPGDRLTFYARLRQGDIFRELNEFHLAEQTYETLQHNFSQHQDIDYALLALAECHAAQAADDSTHAESAHALFEDLFDRVNAPVDVRIEAGFNLGSLHETRHDNDEARKVWWRVITAFLLDRPANALPLDGSGRYWIARTLLQLGTLEAREGNLAQARRAWQLILEAKLPGDKSARDDLASLDAPAPKP
jgi:TolA-binding protein